MKQVYLAGPIAGLTRRQATEWRRSVMSAFAIRGIQVRDPMRDTEFRGDEDEILTPLAAPDQIMGTARAIVTRDRFDIEQSDVVLANLLDTARVSIGTMIEIGWASANHKPIVVMMRQGDIHDHPFVTELANFIVSDIEDAITITRSLLNAA